MTKPLPLDERIAIAAQLIKRARIFYDLWWFYEGVDTRAEILDTMNRYSEFFRYDSHAHFVSLVVHLAALFEARRDTINFYALIDEAGASGLFLREVLEQAWGVVKEIGNLPSKVAILRNNLFAHRSASISYEEAFRKAEITPNQLRDLTVAGLRVANILSIGRDRQEAFFHELSREDLKRLLYVLAKTNGS